jgi:hypothetical protein
MNFSAVISYSYCLACFPCLFFLDNFLLIRTSEGVEKEESAPQEVSVLTSGDNPEMEEEEDRNLTVVHSMEVQNLIIQAVLSIRMIYFRALIHPF